MTENYLAWLSNGQVFDLVLHPGAHFVSKLQPVVKPLLPGFHPHFIGILELQSSKSLFLSGFHFYYIGLIKIFIHLNVICTLNSIFTSSILSMLLIIKFT